MLNDEGHVRCPATSAGQPETRLVVNLARVRSYFRCAFGDLGEGPEFRQSWVVHAKELCTATRHTQAQNLKPKAVSAVSSAVYRDYKTREAHHDTATDQNEGQIVSNSFPR